MAKKILILGATGAMGRYLTPKCVEAGYDVDAVCLEDAVSYAPNLRYIKTADARAPEFVDEIVKNGYDAVVDFMIYNSISFRETFYKYLENDFLIIVLVIYLYNIPHMHTTTTHM